MFTAVESFCGAGGMALGLREAGFDVRYAFDLDSFAVETYRRNISKHAEKKDINEVTAPYIFEKARTQQIDLLSGGPPCQGFSKQRRHIDALNDPRNELVKSFFRLVYDVKPRVFIFENVEIFGQIRGEEFLNFANKLLCGKYILNEFFATASEFGLAQARSRFLLIGVSHLEKWHMPIIERVRKVVTVRDAIGDLPVPPDDYSDHPEYTHHSKARISKLNQLRISHVPPGGGWRNIPHELRLRCHQNVDSSKGGWPDVYGRLKWDGYCPTITAGFDNFSRGRYAHPSQDRALTLREGARLQGFPDSFEFCGTRHDIRKQIGNAVPPPLAKAAGMSVRRILEDQNCFPPNPLLPEISDGSRTQVA